VLYTFQARIHHHHHHHHRSGSGGVLECRSVGAHRVSCLSSAGTFVEGLFILTLSLHVHGATTRKAHQTPTTRTNTSAHDDGGAIFASGRARPAGESIQQCGVINQGKILWCSVRNLLGPVSYVNGLICFVGAVRLLVRGGGDVCHLERLQ